jgi:hypothetical protein
MATRDDNTQRKLAGVRKEYPWKYGFGGWETDPGKVDGGIVGALGVDLRTGCKVLGYRRWRGGMG